MSNKKQTKEYDGLENAVLDATSIKLYKEGKCNEYPKGSIKYQTIVDKFLEMMSGHNKMPAFGVSLHEETLKAMKKGIWVEFIFSGKNIIEELPFESLLMEVDFHSSGFNTIRKNDNLYNGRCVFTSLIRTMKIWYDTLIEL